MRALLVSAVLLALAGCHPKVDAAAWNSAITAHAGPTKVEAVLATDPPTTRANRVHLRVAGPAPTAEAVMPAMGAMPEMRERADVSDNGDGTYELAFDLPMEGGWFLDIALPTGTARFALATGRKGLTGDDSPASSGGDDGSVQIDSGRRQQWGIRTAVATTQTLHRSVHAPGTIGWDESRAQDIALLVGGRVRDLQVSQVGQSVSRGQELLSLVSPDLIAAQSDYLVALAHSPELAASSRRKLVRLGMADADIDAVAKEGKPREAVPVRSPVSGYVTEADVAEGASVDMGMRLYRILPLDRVWIDAEVYADEAPLVRRGDAAHVDVMHVGNGGLDAKVALIQPTVDPMTHTTTVRLDVDNPGGMLLPGMFADVSIEVDSTPGLVVPADAVVFSGSRALVFLDEGGGKLTPREVDAGARADGMIAIRSGLAEGDKVVASGTFLVAAESRLRSSTGLWEAADGQ